MLMSLTSAVNFVPFNGLNCIRLDTILNISFVTKIGVYDTSIAVISILSKSQLTFGLFFRLYESVGQRLTLGLRILIVLCFP